MAASKRQWMRLRAWLWGAASLLAGAGAGLQAIEPNPFALPLPEFKDLPPATQQKEETGRDEPKDFRQFAGTPGLDLPWMKRGMPGARTIAILGDLSPANDATDKYLKETVRQLNLLAPEAVFTVGNLVPGLTRSGTEYANEALAVRGILDQLKMPWFPCAGTNDVMSGVRRSWGVDERFEGLYKKYFGPLYYSTQCGALHVIVLDSEEDAGRSNRIGVQQLQWLKDDLKGTFDLAQRRGENRTQQVIVLVHRPLWREKESNWDEVHDLLVAFNRKPIVRVEGMDGGDGAAVGPKVVAVYAGSTGAYSDEGLRDKIQYTVLGATAARIAQDASVDVRGFALVKFELSGEEGGVHPSIVRLAGNGGGGEGNARGGGAIESPDVISANERSVLQKMQAIPNEILGVIGVLEPDTKKEGELRLALGNPLDVAVNVELRLASTRTLATWTARENANPHVESFDRPWGIASPYLARHLEPGANERYKMYITLQQKATEIVPPQVEFVVNWVDPRGRTQRVLLKRRVPMVRHLEVAEAKRGFDAKAFLEGEEPWVHAVGDATFAWNLRGDEPAKPSPEWQMMLDEKRVYLRVRVEDRAASYVDWHGLDWHWGGVASDAVSVAWAPPSAVGPATSPATSPAQAKSVPVERVWVFPFAPPQERLWKNTGVGEAQTKLVPIEKDSAVISHVAKRETGYTVTLCLPRNKVLSNGEGGEGCVLNVSVSDNDGRARTFVRSWAKEDLGPAGWGRVKVKLPETQPATMPATRPAKP